MQWLRPDTLNVWPCLLDAHRPGGLIQRRTSWRCRHGAVAQLRQLVDPLLEISSGDVLPPFGGGLVPGELTINRLASVQRDLVDVAHHQRGS